jgi:UDP-glucose 4-epimerase
MKRICVIGGTGFIGSSVVKGLLAAGRQVSVIGRSPQPSRTLPAGVAYCPGDLGNRDFLADALRGVDEVIDLAYTTVPKTSFDHPVGDILGNLPAAVTLLQVAGELALKRVVVVSSGGVVYGNAAYLPITEDHPTNPISPYGITKLAVEKYALMYWKANSLPVVCVRPANAYGEGQRPFIGQGFVATAIASILKGREVSIYGENGTVRDYIHVDDVASGIIAAMEKGVPGSCYNVGTGVGRSNRDVLNLLFVLARTKGLNPVLNVMPLRQFDVAANILSSAKLFADAGWQAEIGFEEGIERTWEWFCRRQFGRVDGRADDGI